MTPRRALWLLSAAVSVSGAQNTAPGSARNSCSPNSGWTLDRLQVRQSFDRRLATAPASFSYSIPTGAEKFVAVAAAARYRLPFLPDRMELGPSFEAAANTSAKRKQDHIKGGISGSLQLFSYASTPQCPAAHRWSPLVDLGIAGDRDRVARTSGVDDHVTVSALFRSPSHDWWSIVIPNNVALWGPLNVVSSPYAGYEHSAASDSVSSKDALRGLLSLNLDLIPKPIEAVQVLVTAEYRKDWVRSASATGDGWNKWFTAQANYALLQGGGHKAGIGVTYQKGANPSQGFARQELTQLFFKLLY
jgi:hypothetical protein